MKALPILGGKRVPLAGQRKQFQPVVINPTRAKAWRVPNRLHNGLYECKWWMWGSYGEPIEMGRVDFCVMDDFGYLVDVATERTWW